MKILFVLILFVLASALPLRAEEGKETTYIHAGAAYYEAQEYQKAAQAFRDAARMNPDSAEAHKGLAMSYLKIGYSEGATNVEVMEHAVAAFREVLRIAPGSAETRYQLAVACLILYDKKSAQKEYEVLKDADPALARQLKERIDAYKQPKSFGKVVTRVGADSDTTRITMMGNHVLVPVTLSHAGRTVQTSLVLDTGASSTMITDDVAKRLALNYHEGQLAKLQVADGRVVQAWHMKLEKVAVGRKTRDGLDVVIIEADKNFPFEGLLGMDFLRNFKHSIDFGNQVINWAP